MKIKIFMGKLEIQALEGAKINNKTLSVASILTIGGARRGRVVYRALDL